MRLNKSKLTNYRNCEVLELDFNKSKISLDSLALIVNTTNNTKVIIPKKCE